MNNMPRVSYITMACRNREKIVEEIENMKIITLKDFAEYVDISPATALKAIRRCFSDVFINIGGLIITKEAFEVLMTEVGSLFRDIIEDGITRITLGAIKKKACEKTTRNIQFNNIIRLAAQKYNIEYVDNLRKYNSTDMLIFTSIDSLPKVEKYTLIKKLFCK